jgi:hypothetical protein
MSVKQVTILFVSILFISGCSKTVEIEQSQTEHPYFYKVFSSLDDGRGRFVDELPNGDIIIAGARAAVGLDPRLLVVKRTNAFGSVIWEMEIGTTKEFYCQGVVMSNGDYVFNSPFASTEVIRINAEGKIIYHVEFNPSLPYNNLIGIPVEGEDGNVIISHTNGLGTGGASDNYIYTIDGQGKTDRVQIIEDYNFAGKIFSYNVIKYVDGEYWITGIIFEEPFTGWSDIMKTFVAKVKQGNPALMYVKDSRDSKYGMQRCALYTSDNNIVTVASKTTEIFEDLPQPQTSFDVLKIDQNVELKWKTTVALDVLTLEPWSINENSNGEFVVTGHCSVPGSTGRLPFVVKLSADGTVVFSKIFSLGESVQFDYGLQSDDGSYIFAGTSIGFGNSIEHGNIVLMKTDELGNRE